MERLVRHDGESRDTDRLTWSRHRRIFGGQGVRREAGSERFEENHRVVILVAVPREQCLAMAGTVELPTEDGIPPPKYMK